MRASSSRNTKLDEEAEDLKHKLLNVGNKSLTEIMDDACSAIGYCSQRVVSPRNEGFNEHPRLYYTHFCDCDYLFGLL